MLVAELLLIKDCSIFINRSKMHTLRQLLRVKREAKPFEQEWTEEMKKLNEEIKNILLLKECGIITKKYSSKLDMEHFKALFQ